MNIDLAYNEWAEQYDSNRNKTRDLDAVCTQKILGQLNFSNVLELGCGTGKNTQWFSQKAQDIIGLDFSEEMLEKARTKNYDCSVTFKQANLLHSWPVDNQWADLASVNLVLEHIGNLNPIFAQAHQKLTFNGYFFVSELHPFKQYQGSKARFEFQGETHELETFTHHISEYLDAATLNGFKMVSLQEWFDNNDHSNPPRLISFLFQK